MPKKSQRKGCGKDKERIWDGDLTEFTARQEAGPAVHAYGISGSVFSAGSPDILWPYSGRGASHPVSDQTDV
jgi:hypothetical protein